MCEQCGCFFTMFDIVLKERTDRFMRKNFHFAAHIYMCSISLLLSVVLSFYITVLLGFSYVLPCAVFCTQIFLGVLVYRYLHWGYDLSVRDRPSLKEFLLGMLPVQLLHFLFYTVLYCGFMYLYRRTIFESLPLHRLAANTPVLGFTFALSGVEVLYFVEDEEKMSEIHLPENLFLYAIAVFFVFSVVSIGIAYLCYLRGVHLNDRERKEMLSGDERIKKGSFAKRFRFVPIVNLFPIFIYLNRCLFRAEYKVRSAILPLAVIVILGFLWNGISFSLADLVQSIYVYFALNGAGVYLLGVFVSSVVSYREK